jgi:UDP-N-acetylmuramoyl-tripeptide--D-alanyl-D-alanine ligase
MEMQQARQIKNKVFYGESSDALVSCRLEANAPYLSLSWTDHTHQQNHRVNSQLTGEYNLDNILAAICIGLYFKLNAGEINRGISGYRPQNNRSQLMQTASNTLICDYYNANPSSMAVAIDNISRLQADDKVLILGDMFELGVDADAEHLGIIKKAMQAPVNQRIFIGTEFYRHRAQADATFYATVQDAIDGLKAHPVKDATVLIKGSRGMALERLAELF